MLEILEYKFFINALIVSLIASVSCGFVGTYIVSRRMVFMSGGISHASFGGIGIAHFLGFDPLIGASIFSIISAWGIETFSKNLELRQDSLIGIIWSFGIAVGVIFIYLTPGYASNLMSYLFGSILSVSEGDLYFMLIVCILVILTFFLLFKEILYVSFDREFSRISGIPEVLIRNIMITITALTIVINIRVVGIILVIALLTIPQTIANIFYHRFKQIIVFSILIGFFCLIIGLFISYAMGIPSGATIIFCLITLYILVKSFTILRIKYFSKKI